MKDIFRHLDLNLLRVFAILMAEGNVTRAAARLSLSQSAVSNALNRLRQSLDDVLFEKTTTGIRPTARAHELWSVMQPHFEALKQAISPDPFDAATFAGTFKIAVSDYTAERVMPRLAEHLGRYAPSMRIGLVQYDLMNLQNVFDRGSADLAIGGYLNDASRGGHQDARTLAHSLELPDAKGTPSRKRAPYAAAISCGATSRRALSRCSDSPI